MRFRQPHQLSNAQFLQTIKGNYAAARYLKACGYSIEAAIFVLLGV